MRVYTIDELLVLPENFGPWGKWSFDPDLLVLRGPFGYEVDLERIDTSAQMLDWIFQVAGKGPDFDVAGLVDGLNAVLYPQSNYCSWGKGKTASGRDLALDFARRLRGEAKR